MKTLLPAQLTNISSKADRTWKLQFATRELSGEEAAHLTEMILNEGWLLFAPNETDIAETDVPKEKADSMTDGKSPSQRLRSVIYVYWEQKGKKNSFETFYQVVMGMLIDQIKEKLE